MFNLKEFSKTELFGLFLVVTIMVGGTAGFIGANIATDGVPDPENFITSPDAKDRFAREEAIVNIAERYAPAVVSVIVSKDVPIIERCFVDPFGDDPLLKEFFGDIRVPAECQRGTERQRVGGGTGFIATSKGLIVTNKHVVLDEAAEYTVITNDGERFTAEVLARDPLRDLAVLQIDAQNLPTVTLGNSSTVRVGQTAIAIGNALGEFRNSVSVGVVSGLSRTVTATGPGIVEELRNIIQTDAAINRGNSGGPLMNLRGEVIGVNTAVAERAQNIGFAIPVNAARHAVESVQKHGSIIYPFLGVRFITLTPEITEQNDLPVENGAWLHTESSAPAVLPDSPAAEAGLQEEDIITHINSERITQNTTLVDVLQRHEVGETVQLRVLRSQGEDQLWQEITLEPVLVEREF